MVKKQVWVIQSISDEDSFFLFLKKPVWSPYYRVYKAASSFAVMNRYELRNLLRGSGKRLPDRVSRQVLEFWITVE